MNTTKKTWSKEEERVLLDQINRQPNLKEAFIKTAELLNRSIKSCQAHWYQIKQTNKINIDPKVINFIEVTKEPIKISIFTKILNSIKSIFKL